MKLFAIKHEANKAKPTPPFFSSKQLAKAARDEANKIDGAGHIVVPGPEHRKYKD